MASDNKTSHSDESQQRFYFLYESKTVGVIPPQSNPSSGSTISSVCSSTLSNDAVGSVVKADQYSFENVELVREHYKLPRKLKRAFQANIRSIGCTSEPSTKKCKLKVCSRSGDSLLSQEIDIAMSPFEESKDDGS